MRIENVAVENIIVERSERQRRELPNLNELAASIRRVGLINAPLLTPEYKLIAGERRFTACASLLGWTHIPCQIGTEEEFTQQFLAEFEENASREDLTWQEHSLAILNYHKLLSDANPDWTQGKTAKAMGMSNPYITGQLRVAQALEAGEEDIVNAERFTVARNIIERRLERAAAAELDNIEEFITSGEGHIDTPSFDFSNPQGGIDSPTDEGVEGEAPVVVPVAASPFLHADFNEWSMQYVGRKFNLVHCDFPYGINFQKMPGGAANTLGGYEDSKDVYFNLLDTFEQFTRDHVSSSAHLVFWYSMKYDMETRERLDAMGWKVAQRPLIWFRSDNSGILPDPKRGPRWNYETALFASRGDRPIVRAKSDCVAHPNTKRIHSSEKPIPVVEHFLSMLVDEHTHMIDPTMGSGNAVVAAEALGAASVLGLERDENYFRTAVGAYSKGLYYAD